MNNRPRRSANLKDGQFFPPPNFSVLPTAIFGGGDVRRPQLNHSLSSNDAPANRERGRGSGSVYGRISRMQEAPRRAASSKQPTTAAQDTRVVLLDAHGSGEPVCYRSAEEKAANPDRLSLDRRSLTACPVLEGEENLRLLNYQHNSITKIQHLSPFRKLIFLDLYDNQIERISGLTTLKSLRVLMLGKNRICRIEGLETLLKLDVLDLHGNEIVEVENLSHLSELRVLNLASNRIREVNSLAGMSALTELNLRRNRIVSVLDVDRLPSLQRLFLSFNEVPSWEAVQSLAGAPGLVELTMDATPFSQQPGYRAGVVASLPQLRQLDLRRVSEEERRVLASRESGGRRFRRSGSLARSNSGSEIVATFVSNSPALSQSFTSSSRPSSAASTARGSRPNSGRTLRSPSPVASVRTPVVATKPVPDSGYEEEESLEAPPAVQEAAAAEVSSDTMTLVGPAGLDSLDKPLGLQAAGQVTQVVFRAVDFTEVARSLHKVRARLPAVTSLTLEDTNVRHLHQLNSLLTLRRLEDLEVGEGNPVTKMKMWEKFVVFRLCSPLQLRRINGREIDSADLFNAEKAFQKLCHFSLKQNCSAQLCALRDESRRKDSSSSSNLETLGSVGLTAPLTEAQHSRECREEAKRHLAHSFLTECLSDSLQFDKTRVSVSAVLPAVLRELAVQCAEKLRDRAAFRRAAMTDFLSSYKP